MRKVLLVMLLAAACGGEDGAGDDGGDDRPQCYTFRRNPESTAEDAWCDEDRVPDFCFALEVDVEAFCSCELQADGSCRDGRGVAWIARGCVGAGAAAPGCVGYEGPTRPYCYSAESPDNAPCCDEPDGPEFSGTCPTP